MIATLFAAATAAVVVTPPVTQVGYDELAAGQPLAAIAAIENGAGEAADPARLINLGIAHARTGDRARARALFVEAYNSRDWVELETAAGTWTDSRTLARRALAMLDADRFAGAGRIASR